MLGDLTHPERGGGGHRFPRRAHRPATVESAGDEASTLVAGNQQGDMIFYGGRWWWGVRSTVVWSRTYTGLIKHRVGVQAGASQVKWSNWASAGSYAYVEKTRVAYDNYQFAEGKPYKPRN